MHWCLSCSCLALRCKRALLTDKNSQNSMVAASFLIPNFVSKGWPRQRQTITAPLHHSLAWLVFLNVAVVAPVDGIYKTAAGSFSITSSPRCTNVVISTAHGYLEAL